MRDARLELIRVEHSVKATMFFRKIFLCHSLNPRPCLSYGRLHQEEMGYQGSARQCRGDLFEGANS